MIERPRSVLAFSREVLLAEAGAATDAAALAVALQRATAELHARISPLVSVAGASALLQRALKLSSRDYPGLRGVAVTGDDGRTLAGLPTALQAGPPDQAVEQATAVLAHFISLLVTFIGEAITLRKVREAWPHVPFGGTGAPPEA